MSIVAIVASPRKKGNTNKIIEAMAEGAKKNGKDVKIYHLNALTNAKGCQACMACKTSVGCAVKDDNGEILKAIRDCEGLILSTPNYFGEASGQFRLLQDRFYSFIGADFVPNIEPKKLVVVVSCGGPAAGGDALADKIEGSMVKYFKFEPIARMVIPNATPIDTVANDPEILEKAAAIGKKF